MPREPNEEERKVLEGEPLLQELWDNCPSLTDERFLKRYPRIWGVVGFLHASRKTHDIIGRAFEPYRRLGVVDTRGYVEKLEQGDKEAIRLYTSLRNLFHL